MSLSGSLPSSGPDAPAHPVPAPSPADDEHLRSTLLAGVAHDFRTPLATIIGAVTSLLEQGPGLDAAQQRVLLQHVLGQAQHLHTLSSHVLDLVRMEAGAVRLSPEWCPVDDLVHEALAPMGARVARHRLRVQVQPDDVVWCDPRLLQQALGNLVDNAVRHAPVGSTIGVAVQVRAELPMPSWQLAVQDEGPGVPAGLERQVFQRFFHGPAAGGETGPSRTGLGLALCAAVARLHGGSIDVSPGRGACFTMRLPQPGRDPAPMVASA